MTSTNENIEFNYKKPSTQLNDFVHIYWEHKNLTDKTQTITILPDSFLKLILLYKQEELMAFFMTGIWTNEFEFSHPSGTVVYGIKFKILAPEFIFQNEIASIFSSHKDLSPDFLNIKKLKFHNIDNFAMQMNQMFNERLEITIKKIKPQKLQLSQLLYSLNGNITVEEISNLVRQNTVVYGFEYCYKNNRFQDILTLAKRLDNKIIENDSEINEFIEVAELKVEGF